MLEYESAFTNNPHEMYREMTQAFIDEQFDNTSAKTPQNGGAIMEQIDIGVDEYECIEAWVSPTVGQVSSGHKDSGDFLNLTFKSIDHITTRGLYYKFDNNYWIVNSYNSFNGLYQDVCIRRCNNVLRVVDKDNGSIFSIPCVVDYDLMSPAPQVGKWVITPNNHAQVYVQGNADTYRLFTLNTRFLLGGRPFKIYAFQNTLDSEYDTKKPTWLILEMYLDEEHAEDDIENGIADNGTFDYDIAVDSADMTLPNGSVGNLKATVTLNGKSIERQVVWASSNSSVIDIDENGKYFVIGKNGEFSVITATLLGNPNVSHNIVITVASLETLSPIITISPMFDKVRQFETIEFSIAVEYGGASYENISSTVTLDSDAVQVENIGENRYAIKCNKPLSYPIAMSVSVSSDTPSFADTQIFEIRAVSMYG